MKRSRPCDGALHRLAPEDHFSSSRSRACGSCNWRCAMPCLGQVVSSDKVAYVNHAPMAARTRPPRLVVVSSSSSDNSSSSTTNSLQQKIDSWRDRIRNQDASKLAAASGTAVALAIAAPATYDLLSSASLPPVGLVAELAAGLLAGSAALAKIVYGENVHLELHKGQVYLQLGVPKSGPVLQPDSVVTRPTGDVRGNGAYATQVIPAGTHIADYAGEVLSNADFFSRYPDGVGDYVMAIDRDYVIDAAAFVAATDSFHPVHMNHSRQRYNVVRYYERSKGRVAFFATRDIQPGEELLFDYGRAYWKGREHLELP